MRKKYLITTAIILGVLCIDQLLKFYIDRTFPLHHSTTVIRNFFDITYIRNSGAAFGMFAGQITALRLFLFSALSIAAILVIFFILRGLKENQTLLISSLSLIIGGALGNLIDRVRLGEVIDFIDIHWYAYHWPAFNIADSAITVGGVVLIFVLIFRRGEL